MTANQMKKFVAGIMGASLALMLSTASAGAATYNFYKLSNNNVENLGSQLTVEVLNYSATQVSFKFMNNIGIASSITDIYFDDAATPILAVPITFLQSAGVSFTAPATPSNLPDGNTASPPFVTSTGLSADSNQPNIPANGVNALNEYVTLILNYTGINTIASVLAALGSGDLRIGLHVQAIGAAGGSDGYINNQFIRPGEAVVPLPAALPLLLGGLGGLGWLARRQKRRGSAAA